MNWSFQEQSVLPASGLSRRQWLQVGLLGGLGLAVPAKGTWGAPRQPGTSAGFGRARSVLLVYANGGQSQLETWDPKPEAPVEVRGEFGSILTTVPGLRVCEHLPRLARVAHRCTVVRSMTHEDRDHGSASYLALTGQYHQRRSGNPPPQPHDLPTYGAVVQQLRREGRLPTTSRFPFMAVHVNAPAYIPLILAPGQFAGLLGRGCEPLTIGDPTLEAGPVTGLDRQPDLSQTRIQDRRRLLDAIEGSCRFVENNRTLLDSTDQYRQAYELLAVRSVRQAFDLEHEPDRVRDRYGRHRSGQSCLLARRLVEAGVPWITLMWNHCNRGQDRMPDNSEAFGWDTHNDIFTVMKDHLLPRFDQSFSALLEDLDQRGLLDQTLVVCMGEFGRAPLVTREDRMAGDRPGRAHWPTVYSIVLAGAGIMPGVVYGASDRRGTYPASNPVGPWDVAATLYHALGIDPAGHYQDATGRPYQITIGQPITGLYGN